MIRKALLGAAAGAVGTVVLDAVAYGDEVVCGVGLSSVPSLIAGQSNDKPGIASPPSTRNPAAPRRRTTERAVHCARVRRGLGIELGRVN